jgi:predicted amidohydrolase YtcJ
MLVFSAADFEDFLQPRPDLPASMEEELTPVVTLLAQNRWPFRLHATYDESITRALNVYEAVNREVPFTGLHWFIDHAETISPRNIDRIAALGGGIAIQNRMAFQGEYFLERYGKKMLRRSPPVREMLRAGLPVGAGTDATRVASYNPFVSLYWLVTGRTVGGLSMYSDDNCLDRAEALRLWTSGSSWFSTEDGLKGSLVSGQFADLAVLSSDYFSVPDEEIKRIESVLTMVGGKPVYAAEEFRELAPPGPPVLPEWSPVAAFGGYARVAPGNAVAALRKTQTHRCGSHQGTPGFGCFCWAF